CVYFGRQVQIRIAVYFGWMLIASWYQMPLELPHQAILTDPGGLCNLVPIEVYLIN
ncbi:hypothetical protein E4U40_000277, partial [Claviceps sp. LM458 group G5]